MAVDAKKTIEDARADIATLEIQREAIDKRIEQLKRSILALEPLAEEDGRLRGLGVESFITEIDALGITDSCREILHSSARALTPLEVRDALAARGIDLTKHKNAMASVHAILKRLKAQGQVRILTSKDGGTAYKWKRAYFPRLRRKAIHLPLGPLPSPSGQKKE